MRSMTARLLVLMASTVMFTGCDQLTAGPSEFEWAQAALARNPEYEIVDADPAAGTFAVRDKTTGAMRVLRVSDLVATPRDLPRIAAKEAAAPEPVERETVAATPAPVPATPAASGNSVAAPAVEVAATPRSESADQTTTAAGDTLVASGPGYEISRPDEEPSTAKPAVTAAVEKRTDPIICQGNRLMRIDDETLDFEGDALIAERGCDLYISNARIRAGGIGIIARQARVHIVNSTIGGVRGSYEVSDGAEIYVARSTFNGVGRRFDGATMNDLGGNSYATQ
jgi:hypothetical protein